MCTVKLHHSFQTDVLLHGPQFLLIRKKRGNIYQKEVPKILLKSLIVEISLKM